MSTALQRLAEFDGLSWVAAHPDAYPALEVVHIVGIALLLGSLVVFELRVWGFASELPTAALARLSLRLSVAGFLLAAASGLLMFASQPGELLANRAFVWKIGLLAFAGLNAAMFHLRGGVHRADALARAQTVLSLGIWLAVIICGRWMAYL
ncbi:hypothetical protein M8A51_22010 [Schlegelella sp. S2-27]|uniref:Uncharacterized protein n=1 Tax=Caldimonas mangrovi TaxID=2944811 RepID=A0ABT0YTZ1_9BURK|nr:hypothetical protein [Caldimonas mangrovi]MCM5682212.1 hypothetical protein [Caldimonas mangrovi]